MTKPSLAILAPGLLGGSAAMAARASGAAHRIALWARRPEVRHALREQSWCDEICDSPESAVREADLIIIAAPVDRIIPLARQIAGHLRPGAVVTDVGSVKGEISRLGHAAISGAAHFVGSHPMAGSEKTGWEHGSPRLFDRRTCFVTPLPDTDPASVERVVEFWREIGGEPVTVSPDEHDEIVAHISHLPQVLASNLCALLSHKNHAWRNYAGGGLRDTTRIAGSNPVLWRTILEQNRDEVLRAITAYEDELHAFKTALANRDYPELITRMELARDYRSRFRP